MHTADSHRGPHPRWLNQRALHQVLHDRATTRTNTTRGAARHGPPREWSRPSPLTVVTRVHQPGIVVLTLAGEADLVTSPLIGHAINEHLQGAPQRFIIDMRHITILTSAGIGQLVEAQLRGEASNFDVALVALSDAAVHALQVSGNAEQFPIHSTIADALIR